MIFCCNRQLNTVFSHIVINNSEEYRRIEYAICQDCGKPVLRDYKLTDGLQRVRDYKGIKALAKYAYWKKKAADTKQGSKQNMFWLYQINGVIRDFNDEKRGICKTDLVFLT